MTRRLVQRGAFLLMAAALVLGISRIPAPAPEPETPAGEILTNARQAEAMNRALGSLESALRAMDEGLTPDAVLTEAEYALDALSELTGRSVKADVTERIFSRFCVGK